MAELESPPVPPGTSPEPSTLGERLMNVFVAPSEVFEEVKCSPPKSVNWIMPLALSVIVGIIYSFVVFSRPGIIQQMRQPAEQMIEKQVQAGKLNRQMADKQLAIMESFMTPTVYKVFGILSAIFFQPAFLFLVALLFWAVGTFALRGQFEYMKAVEAVGLAGFIYLPGMVVAMLLAVIYENLAMNPGPVLLLKHFDQTNPVHVVLTWLNVFFIWYLATLSIALARFTGKKFIKTAIWPFGVCAVLLLLQVGLVILSKKFSGGM